MEFFLSYLFLGEEELRKAEPEEELRLNEVPYCILTKSLFLVPLNLFLGAFK